MKDGKVTPRQLAKRAAAGLLRGARKSLKPSRLLLVAVAAADCSSQSAGCVAYVPQDAATQPDASTDAPADQAADVVDAGTD